jgi:hypothetical protein
MAKNGKSFGEKSLLNSPTTEIHDTTNGFINDCFELTIFCIENNLIDSGEMVNFAAKLDSEQLGDNNKTDTKIKSLISRGCDPRSAYKLGIILTYLDISKLTNLINEKLERRKQIEFDTATTISVVISCFMLHDGSLDDDTIDNLDDSKTDIDRIMIARLKKRKGEFASRSRMNGSTR